MGSPVAKYIRLDCLGKIIWSFGLQLSTFDTDRVHIGFYRVGCSTPTTNVNRENSMQFDPVYPAIEPIRLIQHYKRSLADVVIPEEET